MQRSKYTAEFKAEAVMHRKITPVSTQKKILLIYVVNQFRQHYA